MDRDYNLFGGRARYIIDFSKLIQVPNCEYIPTFTTTT